MRRGKGFTLIELVMIIVILGILAAVALPKYFDIQSNAKASSEKGVLGGVRAGIATYYANKCATATCDYPDALDGASTAACSAANPCFDDVLSQGGITSDWTKTGATTYTGPVGTTTYTYDNATGEFN